MLFDFSTRRRAGRGPGGSAARSVFLAARALDAPRRALPPARCSPSGSPCSAAGVAAFAVPARTPGHLVRRPGDGLGAGRRGARSRLRRAAGRNVHRRLPRPPLVRPRRAGRSPDAARTRRAHAAGRPARDVPAWAAALSTGSSTRPSSLQAAKALHRLRCGARSAAPAARCARDRTGRRSSTTSTRSSPPTSAAARRWALPLALVVLAFVLGISFALALPFVFAACSIAGHAGRCSTSLRSSSP